MAKRMDRLLDMNLCSMILSHLDDSTLRALYISGVVPFLYSLFQTKHFWIERIETLYRQRLSKLPGEFYARAYYVLRDHQDWRFWEDSTPLEVWFALGKTVRPEMLVDAIERDKIDVVHCLLSSGLVDPNVPAPERHRSPVTQAVRSSVDSLQLLLLDRRVISLTPTGIDGDTSLLSIACRMTRVDPTEAVKIARLLLADSRIDPGYNNSECLEVVCEENSACVLYLLEDSRVDPTANDYQALITALQEGKDCVASYLLDDARVDPACRDNLPLLLTVSHNKSYLVSQLLRSELVDPNSRDGEILVDAVRLSNSCRYGCSTCILELLLEDERTDASCGNNAALSEAMSSCNREAIRLLIERDEVRETDVHLVWDAERYLESESGSMEN